MTDVTIFHNPQCGTSRNTLALIRNAGIEPHIVEYLKTPPTRGQLVDLIAKAGLTVRQAVRTRGAPYYELGLDDARLTDEQPTARCDAVGRTIEPPLGNRARHPAGAAEWTVQQGRR